LPARAVRSHLEAVTPRQHEVEDHEVVHRVAAEPRESLLAVARDVDGVALFLEALPDEARDLALVLDDQHPHVTSLVRLAFPGLVARHRRRPDVARGVRGLLRGSRGRFAPRRRGGVTRRRRDPAYPLLRHDQSPRFPSS
jgi:hypothetical protein